MRVAAYLRVSTDRQAEQGLGLKVQEQAIEAWAEARGHVVVGVYRDQGLSGTREAADRPRLSDAVSVLEAGHAEGIVAARLDRLARSLTVQEAILAAVWKAGAHVFAADIRRGFAGATPTGRS